MVPVPPTTKNLISEKSLSTGESSRDQPVLGDFTFIRDVHFVVRVTREEREDIRRWAKEDGMSTAEWVRDLIGLPQPGNEVLEVEVGA